MIANELVIREGNRVLMTKRFDVITKASSVSSTIVRAIVNYEFSERLRSVVAVMRTYVPDRHRARDFCLGSCDIFCHVKSPCTHSVTYQGKVLHLCVPYSANQLFRGRGATTPMTYNVQIFPTS